MTCIVLVIVCLFVCSRCVGNLIKIPLNPLSTMFDSIKSIKHDTQKRVVIIELNHLRRCENPTFIVRLAGPALYLLPKVKQSYRRPDRRNRHIGLQARENTYHYSYPPIADAGNYYLEVMMLYCTEIDPSNFINLCVESFPQSVVTVPFAVNLPATESGNSSRWKLFVPPNMHYNATVLPTRIQKPFCVEGSAQCTGVDKKGDDASLWQHRLFDWVGGQAWEDLLPERPIRVCMVGCSHAREIAAHGHEHITLRLGTEKQSRVHFAYISSTYPKSFDIQRFEAMGCDYAVIGYGHWLISAMTYPPWNAQDYDAALRTVVEQTTPARYNGPTKIFFVSMNYNGLSSRLVACPPYDYRTPPLVGLLNSVLINITTQMRMPYIDMNPVVGPMWDSALDFSHPWGKVYKAEIEWIMHSLLSTSTPSTGSSSSSGRSNPSFSSSSGSSSYSPSTSGDSGRSRPTSTQGLVKEGSVVRFGDAQQLYFFWNGAMRAIPNQQVFSDMGIKTGSEVVMTAENSKLYTIGPALPDNWKHEPMKQPPKTALRQRPRKGPPS